MSQPDKSRGEAITTAQDLTRALGAMAKEVKQLRSYGKHNRAFIVVDVLLTVLLTGIGGIAVHAGSQASQASSAQLALCQAGNVARQQQITLWSHLLSLPQPKGSPPRTKEQQEQITAFRAYIASVFKPRDCSRLGRR